MSSRIRVGTLTLSLAAALVAMGWLSGPAMGQSAADRARDLGSDIRSGAQDLGSDVKGMAKDVASQAKGLHPVRSHQFINMDVVDHSGQKVGSVKEIVLDNSHQRIQYALISADRSLDLGGKHLVVPWNALDLQQRKDSDKVQFILHLDRNALKGAPSIDKEQYSSLDNTQLSQQLDPIYSSAVQMKSSSGFFSAGASDLRGKLDSSSIDDQKTFGYVGPSTSGSDIDRSASDQALDRSSIDRSDRDLSRSDRDLSRSDRDLSRSDRDLSTDRDLGAPGATDRMDEDVYGYTGPARDTAGDSKAFNDRLVSKIIGMSIHSSATAVSTSGAMDTTRGMTDTRSTSDAAADSMKTGEKIGKIEDLVCDFNSGRLLFAVVSFNSKVPNANDKWAALPWSLLQAAPEQKSFAVNADLNSLSQVAYDKNSLPLLIDQSYARSISERFNVGNVYGFVGEGASAVAQATGAAKSSISGTIDSIDHSTFAGMKDTALLRVKTSDGQLLWVATAPKSYIEKQANVKFNKGEAITASGFKTVVDNKAYLIASDVQVGNQTLNLRDAQGAPVWEQAGMKSDDRMHRDMPSSPSTTPSDSGTRSY